MLFLFINDITSNQIELEQAIRWSWMYLSVTARNETEESTVNKKKRNKQTIISLKN